ncbi:MAG: hypothetical protein LBV67_12580 [Streptococcaceae bacterium]|nr:hypothetical protein [Streptococcaceae bacterium]
MIKGTEMQLHKKVLENEYDVCEISEWRDFETKEKVGYNYTVILPKMRYEKMKIVVLSATSIFEKEELIKHGLVKVIFEELDTWISIYNGNMTAKGEASAIKRVGKVANQEKVIIQPMS